MRATIASACSSGKRSGQPHGRSPVRPVLWHPAADTSPDRRRRSVSLTPRPIPAGSGCRRDDPPGYSDRFARLIGAGEAGNQHPESPHGQACHRGGTFAGNHSLGPSVGQVLRAVLRPTRSGRLPRSWLPMPGGALRPARSTPRPIPAESGRRRDDPPGYSDRFARLIGAGEAGDQHPESPLGRLVTREEPLPGRIASAGRRGQVRKGFGDVARSRRRSPGRVGRAAPAVRPDRGVAAP